MNRNYPVSVGGSVRDSAAKESVRAGNGMKAAFAAVGMLALAGAAFYFSTGVQASRAGNAMPGVHRPVPAKSVSLPLFFEPNQGQTAGAVKFLARGSGYGLFLTSDEAVLELQHSATGAQASGSGSRRSTLPQRVSSSLIRMRLEGANSSARVSGASPLPGKSNYFIGSDASKWRQNIPQYGRVEYQAVYPGVDLVYYGNQGQLEYDFRVAPGADPNQIALSFTGAAARIDAGNSGDLILSTGAGDVRFHAPRVYQPGAASKDAERAVTGSFRQLADNKIGFTVGDYDHSRELVIDPTLSYSTYIGGSATEGCSTVEALGCVQVAIDPSGLIYVAGSTTSSYFLTTFPGTIQSTLQGAQNIFIAVINPTVPPAQQLVYATYLGGSGTDSLAGVAVDPNFSIYVAGTTNSPDFPTTTNAFQQAPQSGTHGFVSKIAFPTSPASQVYALAYSTYLAGNGADTVTGLAIDNTTAQNAYVTGTTTSTNPSGDNFPANPNGFQLQSNSPGNTQFFATMITTTASANASIAYSTYFGGGNFASGTDDPSLNLGGGIAVDPPPNNAPNMYFTGTTNMLPVAGTNAPAFPLYNAQQSCLDQSSITVSPCPITNPTNTDAFVVKINPTAPQSSPIYSTYLGGSGNDYGNGIAVDSSGNAYITGTTSSNSTGDWVCNCTAPFQTGYGGGASDAYVVKVGNEVSGSNTPNPLTYFTYLGGSGADYGNSIQVDPNQVVHVAGTTLSTDLPITADAPQPTPGGSGDAFVALISSTTGGTVANPMGDYVSYLGGSGLDLGNGIALDSFYSTYVAGSTQSGNFPLGTTPPFQTTLNGTQDAFVSKFGAASKLVITAASGSPSPSPVPSGTQVAFTFNITNTGPDNAFDVVFYANVLPATGLASTPTAKVTSNTGNCSAAQGTQIPCNIATLTAGSTASVEVDVTPAISANLQKVTVSGVAGANGGQLQQSGSFTQQADVVDFAVSATNSTPTITAGDIATIQVTFGPTLPSLGYSATITPSQTTSPSMVTASTPTFNPTTVVLSGSANGTTTLTIPTVARPINSGSLLRRGTFYAAWLPIGGLSLIGLGIGAGRKRRRWLMGTLLGLIAGIVVLQVACSSTANTTPTNTGTAAGYYTITISGSAGTGASHSTTVSLYVQ